jgi:hypothetical protein
MGVISDRQPIRQVFESKNGIDLFTSLFNPLALTHWIRRVAHLRVLEVDMVSRLVQSHHSRVVEEKADVSWRYCVLDSRVGIEGPGNGVT